MEILKQCYKSKQTRQLASFQGWAETKTDKALTKENETEPFGDMHTNFAAVVTKVVSAVLAAWNVGWHTPFCIPEALQQWTFQS